MNGFNINVFPTLCFLVLGNPSYIAVKAVSMKANSESRPNRNSMKKNNTDHNQEREPSCDNASGYATKANPCPPSATCLTSTFSFFAIKPSTLKMTTDAITEVRKSSDETILASICIWRLEFHKLTSYEREKV